MIALEFQNTLEYARQLDHDDELSMYRDEFHIPTKDDGRPLIYLCGNSLGLQPRSTLKGINQELEDWKNLGVEGYFHGSNPWVSYHEYMTEAMARVVGAKPVEVVVMNTLTVNLHLMMVSFYRPSGKRNKILIEADAFPSDRFAAASQIKMHGLDPANCIIELKPRADEVCLREEDIIETIKKDGEEIALILIGNTNYYTGQFFDMKKITAAGHDKGCKVGFDCAHGAGNIPLNLHDSGCDFAVWCTYKYLNSGPGSMAAAFVHERYINQDIIRFEGWWGHNKETRFNMRDDFDPIPGVQAWQLSCTPILAMAAVWSSLKLFDKIGIEHLRNKSIALTGYLEKLILSLGNDVIEIITPSDSEKRGAQLSVRVKNSNHKLFDYLTNNGVILDWREPNVIRVAPAPMYNSYEDVYRFYGILKDGIDAMKET